MLTRLVLLFLISFNGINAIYERYREQRGVKFRSFYTSVFTPLDERGEINVSVIPKYAEYLKRNGIEGVIVADLFGEGPSLSIAEKKVLIEAWVTIAKQVDLQVFVQIGGIPGPDIIILAKYCVSIKVHGILVIPQPRIVANSVKKLLQFLEKLAEETLDLPILYYHDPKYIGDNIDVPRLFKAASETIPQFKGIKCSGTVATEVAIVNKIRSDQTIMIFGPYSVATWTWMGYTTFSLVELNTFPILIKDIIRSTKAGDIDNARRLQIKLVRIVSSIKSIGDYISGMKLTMELISGINVGDPRTPLEPYSYRQRQQLIRALEEEGFEVIRDYYTV